MDREDNLICGCRYWRYCNNNQQRWIIQWHQRIWQLRAQRKELLGNNLWQEPYVEIADSLYINTRNKIRNNDGLYFFLAGAGKKKWNR